MDRAYLEVDRLDAAECPFHTGEGFVATHRGRVIERFGGQAGAHDVETVRCGLGLDFGGFAGGAEGGIGGGEGEKLGHLLWVDDPAHGGGDLRGGPPPGYVAARGGPGPG